MQTIHKYGIRITDVQTVKLPAEAQILSVGYIGDEIGKDFFLWAIVDPESEYRERREIRIIGTGHPIADDELDGYQFLDTIIDHRIDGHYVWHIFAAEPAREMTREG